MRLCLVIALREFGEMDHSGFGYASLYKRYERVMIQHLALLLLTVR